MKFVSKIVDGHERIQFSMMSKDIVFVSVHDTEDGSDTIVPIKGLLTDNIIGVGYIGYHASIIPHTLQQATLCKYIDYAETSEKKFKQSDFDGADYCCIMGYAPHNYVDGFDNHATLSILMSPNAPELGGPFGSVVSYIPRLATFPQLCTLYDYLSLLCRSSGVNIFRYKTLHLYDNRSHNVTVIKLSQTAEAQRFFLKMWLTV